MKKKPTLLDHTGKPIKRKKEPKREEERHRFGHFKIPENARLVGVHRHDFAHEVYR